MKNIFLLLAILTLAFFSACTSVSTRYASSGENTYILRNSLESENIKIKTGSFVGDDKSVMCRVMNPLSPPDDLTFGEFIGDAIKHELIAADVFDENSELEISGTLVEVDLKSGIGDAYWYIEMEFQINNYSTFRISNKYQFKAGFAAFTVCENARNSLVPAVQEFIKKLLDSQEFQMALHQ